jgi:hypothetical protein
MSTSPVSGNFDIMAVLAMDRARLMREGEIIPASLDAGFDLLGSLDHDWIWVLDSGGEIKGVMVASPCHGTVFVWRIAIDPSVSNTGVIRLLRRFVGDIRKRGSVGYTTLVDASKPIQKRLMGIVEKAGGTKFGDYSLMASTLPREGL